VVLKPDRDKIREANLSEALEVETKPRQTTVRSKIRTEDELKESTEGFILESSARQKSTKFHSPEIVVEAKLL